MMETPTKGNTSSTAGFMTPPKNCTSTASTSSYRCKQRKSLPFSTPPKSCCPSIGNVRSRKHTLVASPLTPKGQVRARFPNARRLEVQCNPPCSIPERTFPFLMPVKAIRAGFDQSEERTRARRLALPPLPDHAFRPVDVSENDFPLLPGRESFLVTPQVQGSKRTLPFLHFMCKESIHETRPFLLKRLSSQRRPSLLLID
jgi:hypothetical protein